MSKIMILYHGSNIEVREPKKIREVISTQFDVIIGSVADDQTIDTLGIYFRGLITEEIAIKLLLPHKLKDQYCIKTQKAIDSIRFSGVKIGKNNTGNS